MNEVAKNALTTFPLLFNNCTSQAIAAQSLQRVILKLLLQLEDLRK